jgi:hypothetical protein
MKRIHLLTTTIAMAFVASAMVATAAMAVPTFLLAEWLLKGNPVTTALATESTGELLLEDKASGVGVLCSGTLNGTVEANSLDKITAVHNLAGAAISTTPLTGTALECSEEIGTCPKPLAWPVGLPWESEAELMEEEAKVFFADLLLHAGTTIGWEVECMSIIPVSDTCTSTEAVSELSLEGATLLGNFSEAFTELAGAKLAKCTFNNTESGVVTGGGPIKPDVAEELTASSEGVSA